MFRFTIRDVLWLTVVVAFAVCWYLERDGRITVVQRARQLHCENEENRREVEAIRRRNAVHAANAYRELQAIVDELKWHDPLDVQEAARRVADGTVVRIP